MSYSGASSDIDALRTELGASGSGSRIDVSYPSGTDGNTMFFDWSFSHRNVTVDTIEPRTPKGTVVSVQ